MNGYLQTTGDNQPLPFDDDPPGSRVRTFGLMGVRGKAGGGFDRSNGHREELVERIGTPTADLRSYAIEEVRTAWGPMTPGQRRKFARNLTIAFAHHIAGVSQRQLGQAFDLPHSRISVIVQEMGDLARRLAGKEGGE